MEIPDPSLERAIREELGLSSEAPVAQQEMLRLKRLELLLKQIKDITGLQHAKNLTFLDLADNQITDITPLGELVNLEGLVIRDNPIGDITPLSNLIKLEYLNAGGLDLTDITPLSNLTELRTLWIWHNQITDITPLTNLTQLEDLNISYNQITDISPLANLTALKELWIDNNRVLDFSPIQGLSLADFRYDQVCLLSDPPIRDRIKHRSLPSIIQAFRTGVGLSPLSPEDFISLHDIYWTANLFGLHFLQTRLGYTPAGVIEAAIDSREEYLAKNPNMIFLVNIKINSASYSHFPEDWFGWVRDENGNPVRSDPDFEAENLIDMRLPEVQDIIVQQAVSVSTCGLYDGIMFDWWPPVPFVLTSYHTDGSVRAREKVEENITLPIVQRIRRAVPDDFLIVCNRNREKLPLSAPYINGAFMETHPRDREKAYTRADIIEIETNLIWLEQNLREPQINCLKGHGIPTEPPDSPANQQQMRLFTTMSLTLSDGYVVYSTGRWFSDHIWYPFWDADLGQPVGTKTQRYQEDIEGLYIREFTNGWAVYNRSGKTQTITLPTSVTAVGNGDLRSSTTFLLPDLDGEIYLRARNPADVNGDGQVNVLDLVHVANNFGKADPDLNGDGVVNILDLTLVAKHLSQNAAAPSQLALIESIPSTAKEVIAVQHALAELEAIPNKSHGVQIAIELLRHYLSIADHNVQETKLLSNYPNPFNPDTWIPYQLSEGATVTVKIYDVTGSLVRTIQVGHKPSGYYHTRERAIYWDGRNQNRETVSSGVYFYTLNTDTYTQTRRMVILK